MFYCTQRTKLSAEVASVACLALATANDQPETSHQEVGAIRIFNVNLNWHQVFVALAISLLLWTLHTLHLKQAVADARNRLLKIIDEQESLTQVLHDSMLQDFQGIALQIQGSARKLSVHDPTRRRIEEILDCADETLGEARARLNQLRGSSVTKYEFEYREKQGARNHRSPQG
jgi:hypothetical protein